MKNKKDIIMISMAMLVLMAVVSILVYVLFIKDKNVGIQNLTYNKLIEKIDKKESFVLVIGRTACGACQLYKPKIEQITQNYKLTIFYIDLDHYSEEEVLDVYKKLSYEGGTPTTFFFVKGEEESQATRILGNKDVNYIINKLKENKIIK